jgi:hypothetical protein
VAGKRQVKKQVIDRTILTYSWFEGDRPVCHLFYTFGSSFSPPGSDRDECAGQFEVTYNATRPCDDGFGLPR